LGTSATCEDTYTDVASGVKSQRPGLEKAITFIREGDTLVVWKLDCVSRSLQHLIQAKKICMRRKSFLKVYKKIWIQRLAAENSSTTLKMKI
jgi:DNA invertase Pin-like site-specific DNA recombinase